MRYLAVLKDSFLETLDCKTLWFLLVVSTLLILLCSSLSFTALTPEEALKDIADGFDTVVHFRKGVIVDRRYPATFSVSEAREKEPGHYTFLLAASPATEVHRLVRHWDALNGGKIKKSEDPIPDADVPTDFAMQKRYLVARFYEQQLVRISIEDGGADGEQLRYRVGLRPSRPELLRGAHRVSILFGAASFRLGISAAMFIFIVEQTLADLFAGIVGLIIALVVTSTFIPDMLAKGRVDLLLSKPISRSALMVCKYVGGLLYVLLNAAYLVGGCWLALAGRSGYWNASFLWSIPILTAVFAVLYSFSAWLGVVTRSPLVSILATIGLWFVSFGVGGARHAVRGEFLPVRVPEWVSKGLDFVYYVLPKASDLKAINTQLLAQGTLGTAELAEDPGMSMATLDWTLILVSSAAFLLLFLALSCISFSKRDY